jgi:hypothetical protein
VAILLRNADSFDHLGTILEQSAVSFRFVHVELQGRSDQRQVAEPIAVQVHGSPTWKLEYPVEQPISTLTQPIILSIWCAASTPPGAVRVAQILAPAVADWLSSHWEQADVQRVLAERFAGVVTPSHGFPTITGDFALHEQPRRRSSGKGRRRITGD